jgi:hypothetical protein
MLLAFAAAFAWGQADRVRIDRSWWRLLSLVLIAASMEEVIGLHERLNGRLEGSFLPGFPFPWVVAGALIAILLGALFVGFIRRSVPAVRWRLLIGGMVFVAGAVGMELWAGVVLSRPGAAWPVIHETAEELMEMLGVVIVIGGILRAPAE